jgi:hypothetical protein
MRKRRTRLLATLLASATIAVGCGGDAPSNDPAGAEAASADAAVTEPTAEPVGDPGSADDTGTDDGAAAVSVVVHATPDARMGVNVTVETTGFRWAPEHASGAAVDGAGHAHLYVDGEKVGRLYGPDVHLPLDPGEHEIRVTLNGNDHADLEVDGVPVEATTTVDVPEPAAAIGGHQHEGEHDVTGIISLAVEAVPDAKAGVNLQLVTEGFTWAPEHASGDHVEGEGHAHLYVDGDKVGRVYGEWVHLMLDPGEHEIRVSLNGNDHADLPVEGRPVEATVTVEVPEPASASH